MTLKYFTTLIIGLMFCFCLLGKQVNHTSPEFMDGFSIQDVVPESSSHDDSFDINDDVILSFLIPFFPLLLAILPTSIVRLYSQPPLLAPKRPPSF